MNFSVVFYGSLQGHAMTNVLFVIVCILVSSFFWLLYCLSFDSRSRRGRDRMVVGFTTTCAIST